MGKEVFKVGVIFKFFENIVKGVFVVSFIGELKVVYFFDKGYSYIFIIIVFFVLEKLFVN